jgi:hypothetical protein
MNHTIYYIDLQAILHCVLLLHYLLHLVKIVRGNCINTTPAYNDNQFFWFSVILFNINFRVIVVNLRYKQ